jgi:hypothetical protein
MKRFMHLTWLMLTLCSTALAAPNGDSPRQITKEAGRYQLFQGEYLFINIKGEGYREKALFKIDTMTGEIFICEGRQFDGKVVGKLGKVIQRHSCEPFDRELILDQAP